MKTTVLLLRLLALLPLLLSSAAAEEFLPAWSNLRINPIWARPPIAPLGLEKAEQDTPRPELEFGIGYDSDDASETFSTPLALAWPVGKYGLLASTSGFMQIDTDDDNLEGISDVELEVERIFVAGSGFVIGHLGTLVPSGSDVGSGDSQLTGLLGYAHPVDASLTLFVGSKLLLLDSDPGAGISRLTAVGIAQIGYKLSPDTSVLTDFIRGGRSGAGYGSKLRVQLVQRINPNLVLKLKYTRGLTTDSDAVEVSLTRKL